MKLRIILCLLVILVLFSACAKDEITASAISDLPVEKQIEVEAKVTSAEACMNVACNSNNHCVAGDCVCNDGYKECNDECILNGACCTEDDCEADESCRDYACAPDNCKVHEEYDAEKNKCVCDSDSRFCSIQRKCIPKGNCCLHSECSNSDYRCVPTNSLAVLCIAKQCKSVDADREASFLVKGVRYDVKINHFLQDGGIDITVNAIDYTVPKNGVQTIGAGVDLYIEDIEIIGGHCKLDF